MKIQELLDVVLWHIGSHLIQMKLMSSAVEEFINLTFTEIFMGLMQIQESLVMTLVLIMVILGMSRIGTMMEMVRAQDTPHPDL